MHDWQSVDDDDRVSRSSTVPTFLCCDDALDIYEGAVRNCYSTAVAPASDALIPFLFVGAAASKAFVDRTAALLRQKSSSTSSSTQPFAAEAKKDGKEAPSARGVVGGMAAVGGSASAAAGAAGAGVGAGAGTLGLGLDPPRLSRQLTSNSTVLHAHDPSDLSDLAAHLRKVAMHSFSPWAYNRGAHHT